jgi:3-phosphoshikimate 1-carboxyvinyltransferase
MRNGSRLSLVIRTSESLGGRLEIPPSKSQTLRAILFASIAHGKSTILNYLHSPDTDAMISACRQLGAKIEVNERELIITGTSGDLAIPEDVIDAGNSGQVLRFVGAVASHLDGYTVITGDHSIRTSRPTQPLINGLSGLGCFAASARGSGTAPLIIKGPWRGTSTRLDGADSQPVSALLIAATLQKGSTTITVQNPGERPWVSLTLSWLSRLGISFTSVYSPDRNEESFVVEGPIGPVPCFDYLVPCDISSLAFPIAAAIIAEKTIVVTGVDLDDPQGDKEVLEIFRKMGADIQWDKHNRNLIVANTAKLRAVKTNVNSCIDAICVLAAVACFAEGETEISGAEIARSKECDRIHAMCTELQKLGADITETRDGLRIRGGRSLKPGIVDAHLDHRVAMALSVAAMNISGESVVTGIDCIAKSYPTFVADMRSIGAQFTEVSENYDRKV